jgi:hypothetical protein
MAKIPNTGQDEWAAEQGSPWVQVNLALRALAAYAAGLIVQSRALNAPPSSCSDGDCYLIAAAPGGGWAAYAAGDIAVSLGANHSNGWAIIPKASVEREGVKLYVADEDTTLRWWGAWVAGVEVFVDTTGAPDGGVVKWDQSNGTFYIG